eukprot:scaffold1525_cov142-Cylindrotheca_fusiformis.AAC.166
MTNGVENVLCSTLPNGHKDNNRCASRRADLHPGRSLLSIVRANIIVSSLSYRLATTMAPSNSNETYCTFTLASDVTAGGLPSEADIAKDLESSDPNVGAVGCSRNPVGGNDPIVLLTFILS